MSACCGPSRGQTDLPLPHTSATPRRPTSQDPSVRGTVVIPAGRYVVGGDDADAVQGDGEGPPHEVSVAAFRLDEYAVTNRDFARFVKQTGHVTDAERFGWSFVFHLLVPTEDRSATSQAVAEAPWWLAVNGADWRHPHGPSGPPAGRLSRHPVVHVSWADAAAYADWAGRRLPTETEWEIAARGGLAGARYPWGDELSPRGRERCNIWRGRFPDVSTRPGGVTGTVAVDTYAPNGYGLFNMAGNVWEWTLDWWGTDRAANPNGPSTGTGRVMRGGSYLCHDSYCNRYRVAARTQNTPDSTTGNTGFRTAISC